MTSSPSLVLVVKWLTWASLWVVTARLRLFPSVNLLESAVYRVCVSLTRSEPQVLPGWHSLTWLLPFVSGVDVSTLTLCPCPTAEPLVVTRHLSTSSSISKGHVGTSGFHLPWESWNSAFLCQITIYWWVPSGVSTLLQGYRALCFQNLWYAEEQSSLHSVFPGTYLSHFCQPRIKPKETDTHVSSLHLLPQISSQL